jgi:hypothetical protein
MLVVGVYKLPDTPDVDAADDWLSKVSTASTSK